MMLNSLQILRALAAWAVVLTHIQQSYYMGKDGNSFWIFFGKYGDFGVDVFFILSGFVMALVAKNYNGKGISFGINRIFRLVPIYWFYTFLLVISILIFPSGTYLTWWEDFSLIKSVFFVPNSNPNGLGSYPTLYVGWTLVYELFFYLIFSLILVFKLPKPSVICAFTMLFIALIFRSSSFLGHSSLLLIEFSIGIFLFEYFKRNRYCNNRLKIATPIIFFVITTAISSYLNTSLFLKMSLAGLVMYSFILMENLFNLKYKTFRLLKSLGDYSYSTYLNHIIIIGWFYWLFENAKTSVSEIFAIACILFTTAILSKISYNFIEMSTYISRLKLLTINVFKINKTLISSNIDEK